MYIQIAGLGNLDRSATRHSIGMIIVDRLCAHWDLTWTRSKKIDGLVAQKKFNTSSWNTEIYLLKSCLPMNINGYSVSQAGVKYGLNLSELPTVTISEESLQFYCKICLTICHVNITLFLIAA